MTTSKLFKFRQLLIFLGFLSIFTLPACNMAGTLAPSGGKYTGQYNAQEVLAEVQSINNKKLIIKVTPLSKTPEPNLNQLVNPITFTVQLNVSGSLDVRSDSLSFPHYKFKPTSSTCFGSVKSASNQSSKLEFCWGGDRIRVTGTLPKSQNFDLNLALSLSDEVPSLEVPARFKISDLMERAKTRNFESIIEFQKVLQAKAEAQLAYLNLTPHGNLSDALGLLSLNYLSVLRSIGDFAPFILPSRWARAGEAKDLLVAEKQSWIIMDLDGMNITESLAAAARRDSEALTCLHDQRDAIEGIRDLVRIKEAAGLLQFGSSDDLTSLMNQVQVSTVQLEGVQNEELSALSHAVGFYNPRAIIGVDPENPDSPTATNTVQAPTLLDLNASFQSAIVKSAELRQVLAMVQWAKDNRIERLFNWLDPAGDLTSGLGASFPFYMEVSFHKIDEMMARKEQVKSLIMQKVSDTFTELNVNVQDYSLAVQSKEIQARRVLRISQNLKTGIAFGMSDLVNALQDQVKADINIINSEYGYHIALSRLNRLLYQGPYAEGIVEDKKDF